MTNLFPGCVSAYLLLFFLPAGVPMMIQEVVLIGAGLGLVLAVWLDLVRGRQFDLIRVKRPVLVAQRNAGVLEGFRIFWREPFRFRDHLL